MSITFAFNITIMVLFTNVPIVPGRKPLHSARLLLERLGLRREGHFRQNVWFKGKWGDENLYAILKDEWPGKRDINSL